MPIKTKLEDYANMNNTGFAFIDLNEELKENLKLVFDSEYFVVNYSDNETEDLSVDFSGQNEETIKLCKKIKEVYKSEKPLFLKIKMDVVGQTDKKHKFYDTIIKDCAIIEENKNTYKIIMNVGCRYSYNGKSYIQGDYKVLLLSAKYNKPNNSYTLLITMLHKGVA